MFIQNQIRDLQNHEEVISSEIDNADEMLFVVAYVRENGVDVILDKIRGKTAKLLCSLDMGITQISGIKKLIENNVEVKVYASSKGTFHPKIWLFRKNKENWKMLIGSANLTRAAFIDNVEASVLVEDQAVTANALMFFNYLWNDTENSSTISIDEVNSLQERINERKLLQKPTKIIQESGEDEEQKVGLLFKYVKNWIDIPKYNSRGISSLWRGWYIIPDQGLVSDASIESLVSYLPFIQADGAVTMVNNSTYPNYMALLDKFEENSNFKRENLKMSVHGLFVRQAKNYLIKFGWCNHPIKPNGKLDKQTLCLTDLGRQIHQCENLECVKYLYTEYFLGYLFNGLTIVKFAEKLLHQLNYLTCDEFNFFVTHAYNDDDLEIIVNLVRVYRSLSNPDDFNEDCITYFKGIKEPTAKNVYGNYVKNVKHNISVIGWCNGFSLDDDFTLKLDNTN